MSRAAPSASPRAIALAIAACSFQSAPRWRSSCSTCAHDAAQVHLLQFDEWVIMVGTHGTSYTEYCDAAPSAYACRPTPNSQAAAEKVRKESTVDAMMIRAIRPLSAP